ncbi:hypothetical protein [Enterococcus casseliflavus]|uniref:hypothetical protein n=1 Tax=Enterococcus casseliflavus TaxID=37734 RepID=UPI003A4C7A1E
MEFNQNEPVTEEVINALKNASFMTFVEEEKITISKNEYKDLLAAKGKAEVLQQILSNLGYLDRDVNIATEF